MRQGTLRLPGRSAAMRDLPLQELPSARAGSSLSVIIGVPEAGSVVRRRAYYLQRHWATVGRRYGGNFAGPADRRCSPGSKPRQGCCSSKAGTLDDTSILKPAFHCYTKSKQDWVDLGDIPGFETVPQEL